MTEIDGELVYEILRKLQARQEQSEHMMVELHNGQNALRGYLSTMQNDMTNVYGILSRIDQRLDRIERRLELHELAESQHPFDPNT